MKTIAKLAFLVALLKLRSRQSAPAGELVAAQELPSPPLRNGRRVAAGYVLTGLQPSLQAENSGGSNSQAAAQTFAAELASLGIRAIVSFQPASTEVLAELSSRGIVRLDESHQGSKHSDYWNFHVWRGYAGDWTGPLLEVAHQVGAERLAIQCTHGVDRTGNACAFLLAVRHGWRIADAWYSVAAKTESTCDGIASVLEELGHPDRRSPADPTVGYNGYRGNGMHAHTNGFRDYLRWLIPRAIHYGARW